MLKDSPKQYGTLSIINHWVLAALMIGMLALGLVIDDMPRGAEKLELMGWHKSFGILILFLGLWRIVWRIIHGFPLPIEDSKHWENLSAKIAHIVLLASIFLMPITGYIMSSAKDRTTEFFGLFTMPNITNSKWLGEIAHEFHEIFPTILMVIIIVHIGAALKHHFINKDHVLKRMLGIKSL